MSVINQPPGDEPTKVDDYHVAAPVGELTRSAANHAVSILNVLLVVVLAFVSFALFWVVARILGIV